MPGSVLLQLSARDRALMHRCAMSQEASRWARRTWQAITHLGGTGPSLLAAGLPLIGCCELHEAARLALLSLILSHLVVQLLKRRVARSRPAKVERFVTLVSEPDCFSFPSGHATAAMSVALAYGIWFPVWIVPLLLLAMLIGLSRVRLRVHYPSDVLGGQVIAVATVIALASLL